MRNNGCIGCCLVVCFWGNRRNDEEQSLDRLSFLFLICSLSLSHPSHTARVCVAIVSDLFCLTTMFISQIIASASVPFVLSSSRWDIEDEWEEKNFFCRVLMLISSWYFWYCILKMLWFFERFIIDRKFCIDHYSVVMSEWGI